MPRSNLRSFALTLSLCSSLLAGVPACGGSSKSDADRNPPPVDKLLFLVGVLDVAATQCMSQASPNASLLASGTLDLAFGSSYSAVVLVGNSYMNAGSSTATDRITLRGADITLETPDGTLIDQYSTVGTGFIDAAAGTAYGGAAIVLIPPDVGTNDAVQSASQVIAKLHVRGEALDGTALTSNELDFPINICAGCLVRYPLSAADPTAGPGSTYKCSTATPRDSAEAGPCLLGQDQQFSCTLCSSAYEICRDPALNPAYR